MRYQGRIAEWKDDRGFGFITPNGGGVKVFLHISALSDRGTRPSVGALITYEIGSAADGRVRAQNVRYLGAPTNGRAGRLVTALKDYSRLAKLQYTGGYTSYTTVLQADQSLFPAELTLASLRAQVFTSSVNIYKAMGGGWVVAADRMTGDQAPPPAERDTGFPPLF